MSKGSEGMRVRYVPKMKISERLLSEITTWRITELPSRLYHGCQSIDDSVNIEERMLVGDKWFSTHKGYAGGYAWHFSRDQNPPLNSRYCLELDTNSPYKAITRPDDLRNFPNFLESCFPGTGAYNLSREFQAVLKLHLNEAFGEDSDVIGYYWLNGGDFTDEICIPECHKYLSVRAAILLPDDIQTFRKLHGR